jgi:hypothetical protein
VGSCGTFRETRNAYKFLVRKPEGMNQSKDADVDGRIILKWMLKYRDVKAWTRLMWLRMGTRGELL